MAGFVLLVTMLFFGESYGGTCVSLLLMAIIMESSVKVSADAFLHAMLLENRFLSTT